MPAKKTDSRTKNTKETQESKSSVFDYLRFGESYTSLVLGIIVVIISTILLLSFIQNRNANKNINTTQIVTPVSVTPEASIAATTTVTAAPTVTKIVSTPTAVQKQVAQKVASTKAPTATPTSVKPTEKAQEKKKEVNPKQKTYVVTADDTLWNIAEKVYKNGYNWVDIARANKLNNPDVIHKGTKLVLPNVEQKITTALPTPTITAAPTKAESTKEKVNNKADKITGTSYTVVAGDTLWNIAVRAYGDGYKWMAISQANKLQNPSVIHAGNKLKIPRK